MTDSSQQHTTMGRVRNAFRERGLVRVKEERVLGGVLAGLGRRLGLQPWPTRLLFLVLLLLIPGSQLLVYPVLWILMPPEADPPPARVSQHPTGPMASVGHDPQWDVPV